MGRRARGRGEGGPSIVITPRSQTGPVRTRRCACDVPVGRSSRRSVGRSGRRSVGRSFVVVSVGRSVPSWVVGRSARRRHSSSILGRSVGPSSSSSVVGRVGRRRSSSFSSSVVGRSVDPSACRSADCRRTVCRSVVVAVVGRSVGVAIYGSLKAPIRADALKKFTTNNIHLTGQLSE